MIAFIVVDEDGTLQTYHLFAKKESLLKHLERYLEDARTVVVLK